MFLLVIDKQTFFTEFVFAKTEDEAKQKGAYYAKRGFDVKLYKQMGTMALPEPEVKLVPVE